MPKTRPGLDSSHDDRDFFFDDTADAFVFETPDNANSGATPQLPSPPNAFSASAAEVMGAASSAPASSHAFLNTPALLSTGVLTASEGAALQDTAAAAAAFALASAEIKSGVLSVFDSQLAALYYEASAQSAQMSAFTSSVQHNASSLNVVDGVQYVTIDAIARDGNGAALLAQLKEAGLQSGSSFGTIASGLIDVSKVGDLLGIADLAFARESAMMTNAGKVTTQADTAHHADTARMSFNVTGAGVKIGVLSDSFNLTNPATASYPGGDNMASNIAGDDLPANTTILQDLTSGGADEGRGMAQLIHDLAPGASIEFATAFTGLANFANNIIALSNAGAKIIVDDVVYFAELAYQEDAISQAIDQVTAAGVTYFSSSGNEGARGYQGTWVDGGAQTIGTAQGGSRSEHFMQFAPGQNYMTIDVRFVDHIVLQWDRPANSASGPSPGAGNDLDLFITNAAGDRIFQQSISANTNADPVEIISLAALAANQLTGTNYLRVGLFSGTAPTEIRVIAFQNDIGNNLASNFNTGTIYGHAASPNAIGVAAAAFSQTPAFGVDPPVVESFSSGGPSTYWYDVNGNRLSSALVSHSPQITAVDGGNTTFFGSDSGTDTDTLPNFFGTSAAAPDAAAIAALMLEAQPGLTRSDVLSVLTGSALDMDDPGTPGFDTGVDNRTGAGLVQADRALTMVVPGSISISDASITEGDSGTKVAIFTVTRSGGGAAFAVDFATSDGSATTADNDYVANSGTLNFGAGVNTQTISVTINGDTKFESDETFSVGLSGATNAATISDDTGTGTITNDDVSGSISISDASITEGDSGTKVAIFTVTRSGGTAAFAVDFATSDGSATTADNDYAANSGTLNFGAGVNTQTISVTINGDGKVESDETFSVGLSGATNAATISDDTGTGTITNDDVTGSISISDASITEGDSGTRVVTFTVTRSGGTAPFNVNFATADGSATTADNDYVANSGTLNFGAGVNTQTISVTINGDTKFESDETFSVGLSGATNAATISDNSGSGTITNDDPEPVGSVAIDDVTIAEGNSGTRVATFTVTRSGGTAAFAVDFATADNSATAADHDYVAASGTLNFGSGVNTRTISVTVNGDTRFESDEAFFVNLSNAPVPSGATDLSGASNGVSISDGQGVGTVTNDDPIFASPTFPLVSFGSTAGGWSSDDKFPRELADVNGDHMADIVGFGDTGVYVSLATGGGSFGTPTFRLASFAPGAGGWSSDDKYPRELADVNGDHMADIVGFGDTGVYVSLATGGGSFGAPTFQLASFARNAGGWSSDDKYPRELADVNGDGRADIVGFGDRGVYVALATGGGSFGAPTFKLASFGPNAGGWSSDDKFPRELADVNGDGMADIVGFGDAGVYVALATGGGSFGAPTFKLASFAPKAGGWGSNDQFPRELADVNADGKTDIVGFGSDRVYVALGNGDGSFKPVIADLQSFAPAAGGWSTDDQYPRHLADINNDGAADIVGFGQGAVYEALSNGFHLI